MRELSVQLQLSILCDSEICVPNFQLELASRHLRTPPLGPNSITGQTKTPDVVTPDLWGYSESDPDLNTVVWTHLYFKETPSMLK